MHDIIKSFKILWLNEKIQIIEIINEINKAIPAPVGIFFECNFLELGTSNGPKKLETLKYK